MPRIVSLKIKKELCIHHFDSDDEVIIVSYHFLEVQDVDLYSVGICVPQDHDRNVVLVSEQLYFRPHVRQFIFLVSLKCGVTVEQATARGNLHF